MRQTNPPLQVDPTEGTYLPGIEPVPSWAVSADQLTARASGDLVVVFGMAPESRLVSTHLTLLGTQLAAATPTLTRRGLWEVNVSTGVATLVASTANNVSLYTAGTNTEKADSYTTPYRVVAGRVYALGDLVVSAATMPRMQGVYGKMTATNARTRRNGVRLCGLLSGQADLPSTFDITSLASVVGAPYNASI